LSINEEQSLFLAEEGRERLINTQKGRELKRERERGEKRRVGKKKGGEKGRGRGEK
jgi:hypothetical protein